jgi:hypothetical protein
MLSFFTEFFGFLRERKKLWLIPLLLALFAATGLLVVAQSAAIAPFIYSLF